MHIRTLPSFVVALAAVLILSLSVLLHGHASAQSTVPSVAPTKRSAVGRTADQAATDAPKSSRFPKATGTTAEPGPADESALYKAVFGDVAAEGDEGEDENEACELVMGHGAFNWVSGTVRVRRNACPPEGDVLDPARSQRLAVRGAARDARRELYDIITRLPLDGKTTVGDALNEDDERVLRLQGLIQNSQLSVEDADDASKGVDVIVSASLRSEVGALVYPATVPFLSGIAPRMPGVEFRFDALKGLPGQAEEQPADNGEERSPFASPSPESPTGQSAPVTVPAAQTANSGPAPTGLIVDARGTGVKPVLLPVLFSEDGSGVYGPFLVGREDAVSNGMAVYVRSPNSRAARRRTGKRAVTVKARRATYKGSGELVLDRGDADRARNALNRSVLERCAVAIIVD